MPAALEDRLLDLLAQQGEQHREGLQAVADAIAEVSTGQRGEHDSIREAIQADGREVRDQLSEVVAGLGEVREGLAQTRGSLESLRLIRPLLVVLAVALAAVVALGGGRLALDAWGVSVEGGGSTTAQVEPGEQADGADGADGDEPEGGV